MAGKEKKPDKEPGYVYILTNPSFREDWVKIGKSSRPVRSHGLTGCARVATDNGSGRNNFLPLPHHMTAYPPKKMSYNA